MKKTVREGIENSMKNLLIISLVGLTVSCQSSQTKSTFIEKNEESLDSIVSREATRDTLATGFEWSEGPVWVAAENMLLFSDVPTNTIYKWTEAEGAKPYLSPSGYTDSVSRGGESGSNGLIINKAGELVLSQHGDRRIAVMKSALSNPQPVFITIADNYKGKKLNSPNDVIQDSQGNYYFTDPPYGLANPVRDSTNETPFQGVYKVTPDGKIHLLIDSLTRPNGLALTPDEKFLLVANSDPAKARWYKFELSNDTVANGILFYDATSLTKDQIGLPDGMKIDAQGNIFATGPGGVFVLNAKAELLGKILFNDATSNCALTSDGKTLFVTSDMNVFRVVLRK